MSTTNSERGGVGGHFLSDDEDEDLLLEEIDGENLNHPHGNHSFEDQNHHHVNNGVASSLSMSNNNHHRNHSFNSSSLTDLKSVSSAKRNAHNKTTNSSVNLSSSLNASRNVVPSIHSLPHRFSVESPSISFAKGERTYSYLDRNRISTPGPIYEVTNNNSFVTKNPTASSHSFPKGKRFVEEDLKIAKQAQNPSPTAYNAKFTASSKQKNEPSYSFGTRTPVVEFRSDSPGPIYLPQQTSPKSSKVPTTFGAGERTLKLNDNRAASPSPCAYDPTPLEPKKSVTFTSSKKDVDFIFFGDKLSNHKDAYRTPGPVYDPSFRATLSSSPSFTFGLKTPLPSERPSLDNPGFLRPEKYSTAPSISISGKEKEVDPTIIHAPRLRYINEAFCQENYGRESPGPKYNISGSFLIPSKRKPVTDHLSVVKNDKKKGNSSGKPPYLGYSISKTAAIDTDSPGPIYSPKDELTTKARRPSSIIMSPPKKAKLKQSKAPPLLYPQIDVLSRIPKVTAPRFVKSSMDCRDSSLLASSSESPGPIYKVDWDSLSKSVSQSYRGKFGGLS
ncbi:hypothetical protein C9374_005807 [Naegleria lovaniensis]|uniref:Uncharacterized protein n=1 Tax=Naegleria lovaniensis TaxID=51637 RepID=A0AA88GKS0_NAELO|nr:uncharacterized protein C9374_005807 [Naegleria lovaniensis]KAG2382015.1 hypothetical protein C9374_005807 [Naegleria lovaniensis]